MNKQGETIYLNQEEALARLRGSKALLRRMLELLPENLPVDRLLTELEARDIQALVQTLHSIKGVAANLSLAAAHKQAVELESLLRAGQLPVERLLDFAGTLRQTLQHAAQAARAL